jgi:hypothetical protein
MVLRWYSDGAQMVLNGTRSEDGMKHKGNVATRSSPCQAGTFIFCVLVHEEVLVMLGLVSPMFSTRARLNIELSAGVASEQAAHGTPGCVVPGPGMRS